MKRLVLAFALAFALAGCSGGTAAPEGGEAAPAEPAATAEAAAEQEASGGVADSDVVEVTDEAANTEVVEHVDEVDLTAMSSTMMFAEVVQMTRQPQMYDGATVTMRGGLMIFAIDEATGVGSYSCYVEDATKCCQRGIGFTIDEPLEDTSILVEGTEVIIRGTFEIYEVDGRHFVRISNCEIWPA